ncbi:MAG: hypothetical protein IKT68_07625 [Clostridia bacterium]|nr:hypothetical protein [Clostridia bacterium]
MEYKPNPLLYGANEDFYSTFKLVVTMRDLVDHSALSQAIENAMRHYPYFCVTPVKTGEDIQLWVNEEPVPVFTDDRCVVLGTEESNGHLLAFGCDGHKIFIHASHYIADGMGISPLLMTVLYLYVSAVYGEQGLNCKRIHMPTHLVLPEEYTYPFPEKPVALSETRLQGKEVTKVYGLNAQAFDDKGLYAYHLHIPQRAMMAIANPSDGSPVSFLSVMLYRAICSLDQKMEESVVAHVQHQYRSAINAPMNRHSLVSYIPVEFFSRMKDRRVELQNTIVRGQVIIGSETEADLVSINRLLSVFPTDQCLDYTQKKRLMRQYIENSIEGKTFGISYVGKMDWCGLDQYVVDLHAYIGEKNTPNMLLIEVMTVGTDFSLTFMQSGCGTRYVNAFMKQLQQFDIPVQLVGEERYTLCDTKLPE